MKRLVFWLFLFQTLLLLGCLPSDGQTKQQTVKEVRSPNSETRKQQNNGWQPATYRGLVIGTSTYTDMLRVFGEPKDIIWQEEGKENSLETWYYYNASDEVIKGDVVVGVNKQTKRITTIIIQPEDVSLPKEDVIKHYGNDYVITKYDYNESLSDKCSGLVESPNGEFTRIEYRERGIAISVNYQGIVSAIYYISEPIDSSTPKCKIKSSKIAL